ncbi:U3 small nucleolar RNA-associated protein 14-like [Bidens hawaiensis]|uniref:U3 small nucleolar RNA-associated protein 14-like n=1 Tax=Bidens hawaiensis TaxID=980011 RepID=UPI004049922D
MAETKRNRNVGPANRKKKKNKQSNWKKGPHLPNALQKQLDALNPRNDDDDEEIIRSDDDLYEYEEKLPEEESKKNRRYDPVENFEYELPEDFEDEDVASDDEDGDEGFKKEDCDDNDEDEEDDDGDDYDDKKHARMLQDITGLPGAAFEGKKKKSNVIVYESYPEAESNPTHDINNDGRVTIDDFLNPLHGKSGFSKLRKDAARLDKKSKSILPPLPKPQQEKIDRKTAYIQTKKRLTEYEPLVKENRERRTIYFNEDIDLGNSTVGAIVSEFRPRTDFEKKMDLLINAKELSDAHQGDGARLLELNQVSAEDVKERQDRFAKMRNLLFRHELKSKRIKHIKSKTYRRLLKKDKSKVGSTDTEMDPEVAKELAVKQEFKRAEERMTLKHKNTSKWAKRIKKRGFDVQDDGTRAAISEQLQQHALLTRKRNSMHEDDDSSDASMDDDDDDDDVISGDDDDEASKLKFLENGKKRTLELLEEDDDTPKSGLLSLPFMARGQKKKKDAADEEARLALQEFESSLKQLEGDDDLNNNIGSVGGRKVFGAQKKPVPQSKIKVNNKEKDNYFDNSESEDDADITEDVKDKRDQIITKKDVPIDTNILREESEVGHDPLFDDISKVSGPKIAYEVSLFSTNTSKKKRSMKDDDSNQVKSEKKAKANKSKAKAKKSKVAELASNKETDIEHGDEDSDTDGETRMVDGVITSGTDYELPSQDDLIKRAFAGDDVEGDFEMAKQEVMNEENPEPEKPVLLPGWGDWTHKQKKRGLPAWMVEEHERAKRKRDEDLKKRPDAHLKHVIISEKVDKKAEKLQMKVLPYPFKNKEHFEQSNRMPLGPEFNPATALGALNQPEVVKKPGVSIQPIKLKKGKK